MRAVALETDSPETLNECIQATRKHGRISIAADYAGLANGFNIGALMEKGIMLKGNGQAPAQLYMEKLLNGEQCGFARDSNGIIYFYILFLQNTLFLANSIRL